MKIPFSIEHREKIESGEYKVFLANGNTVRILAWDLPGDFPIAAVDWPSNDETDTRVETYTEEGWDGIGEKTCNLVIVTQEPELSEFEKGCIRLYQDGRDDGFAGGNLSDEALKESAAELLELARKELRDEIEFRGEEYQTGYKDGKSEAETDLPRWNTVEKVGNISIKEPYIITNMIGEKTLYVGLKCISIHSLEKLPGFKEGK